MTSGVISVVDGNDYLAVTNDQGAISLLNKRTYQRQRLSPPGCSTGHVGGFGGGRLAVWCEPVYGSEQVDLYGLASKTWAEQPLAPQICNAQTFCEVDGVGATWIRFFALVGDGEPHASFQGYLQNIRTGAVRSDPATAPGVQDDLSTASGVGRPCPTLPSSAFNQADGTFGVLSLSVPYWHQSGRFVLTTGIAPNDEPQTADYLYECRTRLRLRLPLLTLVSATAIVYQQTERSEVAPFHGRYLPTLRSFTVPDPRGTLVALSGTTLYALRGSNLWAGTFTRP